jgi:hypothetical protein
MDPLKKTCFVYFKFAVTLLNNRDELIDFHIDCYSLTAVVGLVEAYNTFIASRHVSL